MADPFSPDPSSVGLGALLLAIIMGLIRIIMMVIKPILATPAPNGEQRRLRDDLRNDIHEALNPLKEDISELKRADLTTRMAVLERRVDDLQR